VRSRREKFRGRADILSLQSSRFRSSPPRGSRAAFAPLQTPIRLPSGLVNRVELTLEKGSSDWGESCLFQSLPEWKYDRKALSHSLFYMNRSGLAADSSCSLSFHWKLPWFFFLLRNLSIKSIPVPLILSSSFLSRNGAGTSPTPIISRVASPL